jgi:hypothetical protein
MTGWTDEAEDDDNDPLHVIPFEFDPGKTYLVRSRWLRGTGCPPSDAICGGGDSKDNKNEGLLLVKTGPTSNNASAGAEVKGVKGITLTELGYDIRKGTAAANPAGSHCDNGSPRFNVRTDDGLFFVGCTSPPATMATGDVSWLRLRWGTPTCVPAFNTSGLPVCISGTVRSIAVLFDDGQDTGPDFFGLAVLDNIDVNGTLVGQGPGN